MRRHGRCRKCSNKSKLCLILLQHLCQLDRHNSKELFCIRKKPYADDQTGHRTLSLAAIAIRTGTIAMTTTGVVKIGALNMDNPTQAEAHSYLPQHRKRALIPLLKKRKKSFMLF